MRQHGRRALERSYRPDPRVEVEAEPQPEYDVAVYLAAVRMASAGQADGTHENRVGALAGVESAIVHGFACP